MFAYGLNWAEARDTQKKKVYSMEDEIILYLNKKNKLSKLSENEMIDLFYKIFDSYGITASPNFNFHPKSDTKAIGSCLNFIIPDWGHNDYIIIHETCHALAQHLVKNEYAPHGKEFVSLLLKNLSIHFSEDLRVLNKFAKNHKVNFKRKG